MVRRRIEVVTSDHDTSHLQLIGKCEEWMKALPSESVDVCFADPPYLLNNARQRLHSGKLIRDDGMAWDKIDHALWIEQVARVLRTGVTFFC
jgi:DNA modification methylase